MPTANSSCECAEPGFCERHRCHKTPHWHKLCRTRADYFRLWEEGRGPGQQMAGSNHPPRHVPCRQLGERLRNQVCPSCRGSVRLKVFSCVVHGECTLARQLSGVACCRTCEEYEPPESDSPSENNQTENNLSENSPTENNLTQNPI